MRRILSMALLAGLVAGFVGTGTGRAQPAKEPEVQATVYVYDAVAKKEVDVTGTIVDENITGIKIQLGKDTKVIPALDVRQITYKTKLTAPEFRKGFNTERKAEEPGLAAEKRIEFYNDALRDFKALLPNIRDVIQANRYINFKVAEIQASIAQVDNAKIDDAVKALEAYRVEFPGGFEVVPSLKLLAGLHELKGNLEAASKVYEELSEIPDAPPEIKRTAGMLVTQMLLRAKKYKDAETRLINLRTRLPKDDPQRGQVTVMLCQSKLLQGRTDGVEKDLREALATSGDAYLHAVGHNCLGDFHVAQKDNEAAFWEFLRVHLLYTQDRTEHARALYHLWKLFDSVKNDPIRAQECLDRLLNDKDFAGTEWQTRARAEAKPPTMP